MKTGFSLNTDNDVCDENKNADNINNISCCIRGTHWHFDDDDAGLKNK